MSEGLIRILRLIRRISRAQAGCTCPACETTEQQVRASLGMPRLHPERFVVALPDDQEEYLAALAAELWPDGEWMQVADEFRRNGSGT